MKNYRTVKLLIYIGGKFRHKFGINELLIRQTTKINEQKIKLQHFGLRQQHLTCLINPFPRKTKIQS